ncbi:unnamed protein product [Blepharisma stoltei]|uniref:GOLD domain-containing protein n=1 Tax=Blepharisma stoltei TaxID=1481888 RepID=A0AAU9JG72_9CILI|nr:unnamed protein product [Blepharisma stoltei]
MVGLFYIFLLSSVSALHFYLTEGYEKCFILDVPDQTVVLGEYNLLDPPPEDAPDQGVNLKITDPNGVIIHQRLVRSAGKFSFTSQTSGQNRICLLPTSSSWFGTSKKIRFDLGMDNTREKIHHEHLASKEQVTHLGEIVTAVNERLSEIVKGQNYAREKEALFKDESEQVNSRILWFTIFQTVVILVSGVWQIWSLRRFFISRKLV